MRLIRTGPLIGRRLLGAVTLAACCTADGTPAAEPDRAVPAAPAQATPRSDPPWQSLPPTPDLPEPVQSGMVPVEGARVFFAVFGKGPALLLLHGGLANSAYWGHQVRDLMTTHRVVVMDTRGHGRSPFAPGPLDYTVFARDVAAVIGALGLDRPALLGWSDGAITGLELAIARPGLLAGLFAFGANSDSTGTRPGGSQSPVFRQFSDRAALEYRALSPHPADWPRLVAAMRALWRTQPAIDRRRLAAIRLPVAIADGGHDEIIPAAHAQYLARTIPGAELLIRPDVSHFAMLQDPQGFTRDVRGFFAGLA